MEQAGEFLRQRDLAHGRAGGGEALGGILDRVLGLRLRGVPQRRAAEPEAGRRRQRAPRRLLADDGGGDELHVVDGAGHEPDGVEALGRELDAGAVDQVERRLVADHAAIGRRAQHRAAGLGAERRRHHVVGDRGGRAGRRAAGRVRGIVRIGGRAREHAGELGGDGLAEDHGAGGARDRHAGGVAGGAVALVDRRSPFPSAGRRCR